MDSLPLRTLAKPYRKFFFVCYPESCDIDSSIISSGADKYAYILHDADVDDNGTPKKLHYHVYIEYKNARQPSTISKNFNIAENNIEYCKSTRGCIRYLVHMNHKEKHQYNKELIESNGLDIDKFLDATTEGDRVEEILDLIEKLVATDPKATLPTLIREVCSAGLYSEFRRGQTLFLTVWKYSITQ